MATKADITQRDRDATALVLYECMLGAVCQWQEDAESMQTEAFLTSPTREAWAEWRAKRRAVEGPKREPDPTK